MVIRRKGFKTITRNFPTRKSANDWARDTAGNTDRMTRLGGTGSRMMPGDFIEAYGTSCQGKDKSVPTKLAHWKGQLVGWKIPEFSRQVVAEELKRLKTEPALQPLRGKESRETTKPRSQATVNRYLSTL